MKKRASPGCSVAPGYQAWARALLKWSVNDLCEASGVSSMTVKRIEKVDGIPNAKIATVQAIRDAYVKTGKVRFEGDSCVCLVAE